MPSNSSSSFLLALPDFGLANEVDLALKPIGALFLFAVFKALNLGARTEVSCGFGIQNPVTLLYPFLIPWDLRSHPSLYNKKVIFCDLVCKWLEHNIKPALSMHKQAIVSKENQ